MGELVIIPDVVLDRLAKFIKPEAVTAVLDRPAKIFGGVSACDYVRQGHPWEEVLTIYERVFSYAVTR